MNSTRSSAAWHGDATFHLPLAAGFPTLLRQNKTCKCHAIWNAPPRFLSGSAVRRRPALRARSGRTEDCHSFIKAGQSADLPDCSPDGKSRERRNVFSLFTRERASHLFPHVAAQRQRCCGSTLRGEVLSHHYRGQEEEKMRELNKWNGFISSTERRRSETQIYLMCVRV